eukprot:gene14645-19675_t
MDRRNLSADSFSPTPVIAVPVSQSSLSNLNINMNLDENYYSGLTNSSFTNDTIEMSGNFFSQLDSMIAAVKVESSALDSMKEKLKEVDNLRNQIGNFTKRLLEADQTNLNLKNNFVKLQESYNELKKSKDEIESSIPPLRNELNRTKDMLGKERSARVSAQQEQTNLKEQISRFQQINENLERECKSILALTETNEIMKNDLVQLRKRFKDEKSSMMNHIQRIETQTKDYDSVKNEVRILSLRLLEIVSNGPSQIAGPMAVQGSYNNNPSNFNNNNINNNINNINNNNLNKSSNYNNNALGLSNKNNKPLNLIQQQQQSYQPYGSTELDQDHDDFSYDHGDGDDEDYEDDTGVSVGFEVEDNIDFEIQSINGKNNHNRNINNGLNGGGSFIQDEPSLSSIASHINFSPQRQANPSGNNSNNNNNNIAGQPRERRKKKNTSSNRIKSNSTSQADHQQYGGSSHTPSHRGAAPTIRSNSNEGFLPRL